MQFCDLREQMRKDVQRITSKEVETEELMEKQAEIEKNKAKI